MADNVEQEVWTQLCSAQLGSWQFCIWHSIMLLTFPSIVLGIDHNIQVPIAKLNGKKRFQLNYACAKKETSMRKSGIDRDRSVIYPYKLSR